MSIPQKRYHQYRQARKEHPTLSAKYAWGVLKHEAKHTTRFVWQECRQYSNESPIKTATVKRDGFTCIITIYYDYEHDWCDGRGKFTDTWEEGVILNPGFRGDHRTFRFFLPEVSIVEQRSALQAMGYSRSQAEELARQYVYRDAKVASDPTQEGYEVYGIVVQAKRHNIELGTDSQWGIEIEGDDSYLDECAEECLQEALAEAKKNLQQLQEGE